MGLLWLLVFVAGYIALTVWLAFVSPVAFGVVLGVFFALALGLMIWGIVVTTRRSGQVARERAADWPTLNAWAARHGWRVRYQETLAWTDRLRFTAQPGPYLTVSGQVNGFPVDVLRVPFVDESDDGGKGVHHVVAMTMPNHEPADIRARAVRASIRDGLLVATMGRLNFELDPATVLPAVELVLRTVAQHDARVHRT